MATKAVTKKVETPQVEPEKNVVTVEYETPKGINQVDVTMWYQNNYYVGAPTIDGELHKELMVGGVSKADVEAGIQAELKAIEMADNDICKGMCQLMDAMRTTLEGIKPTIQVEIRGIECMIDTEAKKIYTLDRQELANLDDLSEEVQAVLNAEAIAAMLKDRAKTRITELKLAEAEGELDYWEDEDYDCDGDCRNCPVGPEDCGW